MHTSTGPEGPDVSVVLPAYNEVGHIVELVSRIAAALEASDLSHEIIVVDDDSPDGTSEAVLGKFHHDSRVRLLRRVSDRGLGRSVGDGIGLCRGASVAVLDADFNHDPSMIPAMLEMLRSSDLVIGSRYIRGGAMPDRRRYWASYVFNLLVRALIRTGVHDNLSGYFVAHRVWLQAIDPKTAFYGYGDYFMRLIVLAKTGGSRIRETPVRYGTRPTGTSKTNFLTTPLRYLLAALRLAIRRDRPRIRASLSTAVAD